MSVVEIIFCVVCIGIGAFSIVESVKTLRKCTSKTVGRITGIHESQGKDRENIPTTFYSPEFEYKVNGRIYHGVGDTSYERIKKIKIGGSIKVYYDPENPGEHFTKGGGFSMLFFGVFLLTMGLLGILIAWKA